MFTLPEQFSAATKANFDAQLATFSALTSKAMESVEKMVELNLTVAKTAFEESNVAAKQLISAKDPQEFFTLTAAHVQPSADKALAYARHLASITNGAQAEFTKAAEAHVADTNRKVVAFVDEISKNAPAGSENAIEMLKRAIGNASAGYDQINKSTKQVVETLEANLNTAVNQISQAATKAAPRASKKA
jgi:phasin family protein